MQQPTIHTYSLGELYAERKEKGDPSLPILTVSIHAGVSEGELDEDKLGKKVKRIADKTQYKTAHKGDLVFNMMRAWQGAIGVVRSDGLVSPAYIVAKPNEKIWPEYMDYCMKTPRMIHAIHRQSYGVTDFRLRLYWDSFTPITCQLPTLPEQQKIATILSTQDKVIELKEKLLAQKQQQKKYLMQQLLTGKIKLANYPNNWHEIKLGEVSSMASGGTPDSKNKEYYGNTYNWISISDISNAGKYIDDSDRKLSQSGFDNCTARLFNPGTVLLAMYASVGKCAIARKTCCTSQAILGITPQKELVNEYLYYVLVNENVRLKSFSQASSQPNINKKIVEDVLIKLPSLSEQKAIVEILSTADREIDLIQKSIEAEKQKKKALMQLLLTGKVRVKDE